MIFLNIGVLVVVGLGAWWLTGVDRSFSGESKRDRHFTRALRCVAVLFLTAIMLGIAEQPASPTSVLALLVIPVSIALVLRSSVSELFAHGFVRLLDPTLHDNRELDLKQNTRYLDTIAHLVHNGKQDEAIKLCEQLKQSGEVDLVTLEATLEFLGVKQERPATPRPLNEAAQWRLQGKFVEAEQLLKSLLAKNPADADAAMMLMRLYAQDMRQPGRAQEILQQLERQPHVAKAHIEFARCSIDEWSRARPKTAEPATPPKPETVEELLEQKLFGSAIELLEEKIRAQPGNFDLRLKLAEVHALHCGNFPRAEKIVRQLGMDKIASAAQTASAEAKLKEWREARLPRK